METLRGRWGIPGPNPQVYRRARAISEHGVPAHAIANPPLELSAIAAVAIRGITGRVSQEAVSPDRQPHGLFLGYTDMGREIPLDFSRVPAGDDRERTIYQQLSDAMIQTYTAAVGANIEEMRGTSHQVPTLILGDTLASAGKAQISEVAGHYLEALVIDNLRPAAETQAALLRMIPVMTPHLNHLPLQERIVRYTALAVNSEQFIRDLSLLPSKITNYIGNPGTDLETGEVWMGLWNEILHAANPEDYADYFSLVTENRGGQVSQRLDFSAAFIEEVRYAAETMGVTYPADASTAQSTGEQQSDETQQAYARADNWFGCPGMHKLDNHQVNPEMWRHYVSIAPALYASVLSA